MSVSLRATRYLGPFPRQRTDNWLMVGQDGGQSIDLGEHTLFVFADTLVAPLREPPSPRHAAPFALPLGERSLFLANSAGVTSGRALRPALADMCYYSDEFAFPREVLCPTPEEEAAQIRFWPQHGFCLGDTVYLYYLGIQTVDPASMWGFRNVGAGLAALEWQSGRCRRIGRGDEWRLWQLPADDFHFGVQVLQEDGWVYVFGSARTAYTVRALLARVRPAAVADPDAYEYLVSAHDEWSRELADAGSLGECGAEYSVSFNPYLGRYLMIYMDSYRKTLMLRTAGRLSGPYSPPQRIARVPHEPGSELTYIGFEHAKFRADDGRKTYVSYSQPYFVPNSVVELQFR